MRVSEDDLCRFVEDCSSFLYDNGFFEEYGATDYEEIWEELSSTPAWILYTKLHSRMVAPNVIDLGNVPQIAEYPDTYREQATKVLEEAAECFAAADIADKSGYMAFVGQMHTSLAEEAADVIHAAANLLMMLPKSHSRDAMRYVIEKNARRGRY